MDQSAIFQCNEMKNDELLKRSSWSLVTLLDWHLRHLPVELHTHLWHFQISGSENSDMQRTWNLNQSLFCWHPWTLHQLAYSTVIAKLLEWTLILPIADWNPIVQIVHIELNMDVTILWLLTCIRRFDKLIMDILVTFFQERPILWISACGQLHFNRFRAILMLYTFAHIGALIALLLTAVFFLLACETRVRLH